MQSLNHYTTREVPLWPSFYCVVFFFFQNSKYSLYILDTSPLYALSLYRSAFDEMNVLVSTSTQSNLSIFFLHGLCLLRLISEIHPILTPGQKDIFPYYFPNFFFSFFLLFFFFTVLLFRFKSLIHLWPCDGVRLGSHPSLLFLPRP